MDHLIPYCVNEDDGKKRKVGNWKKIDIDDLLVVMSSTKSLQIIHTFSFLYYIVV